MRTFLYVIGPRDGDDISETVNFYEGQLFDYATYKYTAVTKDKKETVLDAIMSQQKDEEEAVYNTFAELGLVEDGCIHLPTVEHEESVLTRSSITAKDLFFALQGLSNYLRKRVSYEVYTPRVIDLKTGLGWISPKRAEEIRDNKEEVIAVYEIKS